jgi:hypothetical protein
VDQLEIEWINGKELLAGAQLERKDRYSHEGYSVGEPLLSVLAANSTVGGGTRTVRVPRLDPSDPWRLAYLGVFGSWPEAPQRRVLERVGFRLDLSWDEVIPTEFAPVQGSARDLLERLRDNSLSPAVASGLYLGRASAGRDQGIAIGTPLLPRPDPDPSMVGPNLVVVYDPDDVGDLCLLWALRAIHGMPPGLPLAVPVGEEVEAVLEYWVREFAPALFGLGGDRRFRLISSSVAIHRLREIADHRSDIWAAENYRDFLKPVVNPGRGSIDLIAFEQGRGTVATWGPGDRDEIGGGSPTRRPELQATIALSSRPLPPLAALRPEYSFERGPRGDGILVEAGDPNTIAEIEWPVGWRVLEAAVSEHGLAAKPSAAGRAGAALLTTLGSLWEQRAIASMPVLELLNRLAERRGMSWFRERARQLAAGAAGESPAASLDALEAKIDNLSLRPFEGEERGITLNAVQEALEGNRAAARAWVRWAERRRLLIRGVEVTCDRCRQVSWRSLLEVAPPLICRGCGHQLRDPFNEDGLAFRYRAGEPLLRAIEHDAMTHNLALMWWCELWRGGPNRRAGVYGGYPGVDFFDVDSGEVVGEADVLLVLGDGSLAIGECKRHGVGLRPGEIEKLNALAKRLDARFTFVATTSWAKECPPIWQESIAPPPADPPRYSLTGDHLMGRFADSQDLHSWPSAGDADHRKEQKLFVERLEELVGFLER